MDDGVSVKLGCYRDKGFWNKSLYIKIIISVNKLMLKRNTVLT